MEPTPELIRQLHREDIEQAKRMTPEQKLRAGGDMFDDACAWTLAGIKSQNPQMSHDEAVKELQRRLDRARRREDAA